MRIYECTIYEKPVPGFTPRPITIEGRAVSREFTAETASKARYQFYLDLHEAWGDSVRIQDIRVRSLSKASPQPITPGWEKRIETVNAIIQVIGSHGRRFLSENSDRRVPVADPWFARFTVDERYEIWYLDRYSKKPILVRHDKWPGFSDGGTLWDLVRHFADHIRDAKPLNPRYFGPFRDPWGYGLDEMQKVRDGVAAVLNREAGKERAA